jgi:hypothetical protein
VSNRRLITYHSSVKLNNGDDVSVDKNKSACPDKNRFSTCHYWIAILFCPFHVSVLTQGTASASEPPGWGWNLTIIADSWKCICRRRSAAYSRLINYVSHWQSKEPSPWRAHSCRLRKKYLTVVNTWERSRKYLGEKLSILGREVVNTWDRSCKYSGVFLRSD